MHLHAVPILHTFAYLLTFMLIVEAFIHLVLLRSPYLIKLLELVSLFHHLRLKAQGREEIDRDVIGDVRREDFIHHRDHEGEHRREDSQEGEERQEDFHGVVNHADFIRHHRDQIFYSLLFVQDLLQII